VWKLVLASAFVVLASVAAALLLSGHRAKAGAAAPTTISSGPAPTLIVAAPESPTVTGTAVNASQVRFTWSIDSPEPNDLYYWKQAGGTPHEVTGNSVTLPTVGSQQVCIIVELVRSSGYADSALTCAG
jgi:hypothetical protein